MNNEKNRVITDLKLNLLITIGIGVLSFLVTKYFAEYMGISNLGLMRLFTQMVAYLNLAELGVASASAYALYKPLMEKNIKQINKIISTIESFYKKISISILLIGLLLNFSLFYFIDNYKYSYNIHIYWSLYVINTSITYLFAKYSILFTANQEYQYVRKVQGFGKIIFQLFQILILIKYSSFILFIILMIFESIYSYYFYRKHFLKYYNYIKKVKEREPSIIKDMKNLFWHMCFASRF